MSEHREPCGKEGRAENEVAGGYLESVGLGVPGAVQQSPAGAALISKGCRLICAWKDGSQGECFKVERAEGSLHCLWSQNRTGHLCWEKAGAGGPVFSQGVRSSSHKSLTFQSWL